MSGHAIVRQLSRGVSYALMGNPKRREYMNKGKRMRKILYIPLAAAVGGFLFLTFSFSSPCACTDADEDLAMYVGLKNPLELTAKAVEDGFKENFPKGSKLDKGKLLGLDQSSKKYYKDDKTYICNYWIYESLLAKTGYQVVFHLNEEGKVIDIKANDISCWFGFEFAYGS
jgi:hypothetical protein